MGQRIMTIFHLASFEPDRHLTIVCDGIGRKLLGNVSSTYTVVPIGGGFAPGLEAGRDPSPRRAARRRHRRVMPWFELLMMRKQFLTQKRLAEKTAAAA